MGVLIKISFKPIQSELDYIKEWLAVEDMLSETGFYCNWASIVTSFRRGQMATISVNGKIIGFVIWHFPSSHSARIDITEIQSSYRKFGYGKLLINHLFDHFRSKLIYVVDLCCAPASSQSYWRGLKFKASPSFEGSDSINKELYRIIVECSKSQNVISKAPEIIELWDGEPYETINSIPNWTWRVKYNKGTKELKTPIIIPGHPNWRIRWRKGELVIFDGKVWRFKKKEIYFGGYIVICGVL